MESSNVRSRAALFAFAIGATLAGCATTGPEPEEEVGVGTGAVSTSGSSGTKKGCFEDPQPAAGDTRKCCVAENTTTRKPDGSCTLTISASISDQKSGCNDYKSPNTTTQAFLDLGMTVTTSGCKVESSATGKDTVISCSSCPTSLEVNVKDGPDGRKVTVPVP
ncbi:MAG: hypothetical protein JST00_04895 [Deltaproteobacteria bacterium]|nr:hypothetical protein [Deltaproteobacteria bacterium]